MSQQPIKGYKVFNPDFTCNDMQYAENTEYKHSGTLKICSSGLHFCLQAQDCFRYYSFDAKNIVCEVEARGEVQENGEDSKRATDVLFIGRRLSWQEVLTVANSGSNNSGHSNSGDRNSGNWNSGDRNSGNWNSGDRNSGYRNSGYSNSGDSNSGNWNSGYSNSGNWNSGDRNSGNWNSGYRNSGDSNSGYRNAGAFCLDNDPICYLFDKKSNLTVRQWENHRAYHLMSDLLNPCIWVPSNIMTEDEKSQHPKWETTEGYLKTISLKEAWANMWGNLKDEDKKVFSDLPNFDADKFEQITGIRVG